MTRAVEVILADAPLSEAAARMQALDVGLLPVAVGDEVVGMLTDRDITVRATAAGDDPLTTRVRDVMTTEIIACYEDEDLTAGARVMAKRQVRRLLILDRDERKRQNSALSLHFLFSYHMLLSVKRNDYNI